MFDIEEINLTKHTFTYDEATPREPIYLLYL